MLDEKNATVHRPVPGKCSALVISNADDDLLGVTLLSYDIWLASIQALVRRV